MQTKKAFALVMIIIGLLLIVGFGIYTFIRRRQPTAGLKIETTPSSLVFVNDQEVGNTPVDQLFFPGETTVKLIPASTSSALSTYQTKVRLTPHTYTIIKRDFGSTDSGSAGEIISLESQTESTPSLNIITSSPDTASVVIDGQPQGFTPLSLSSLSVGTHQVVVSAPGFAPRTIPAQTVANYKLIINVKLAALTTTPTPTPAASPSPTSKPGLTPTPTPKPGSTPASTPKPTPVSLAKPYVTITQTPVGFLRVRLGPSLSAQEIGQVQPGQSFSYLSRSSDWYQIQVDLDATSSGWISSQYATLYQ